MVLLMVSLKKGTISIILYPKYLKIFSGHLLKNASKYLQKGAKNEHDF